MFIIAFSIKESSKNKLAKLIQFINNELDIYFENDILLAYQYFDKSQEGVTKFFEKIQPSAKEKLKN